MSITRSVVTDDGARLHVEVDDGPGTPTVILCHGYCLNLHAWDPQDEALRGRVRVVRWDQRGHGRSTLGAAGSATIERLGQDLGQVIDAVAPTGPLVLVGHSMGGMTIMALAAMRPDLFTHRVRAVALVSTSSGGLAEHDFGLGRPGRHLLHRGPQLLTWAALHPRLLAAGRRMAGRLTRRWSYADRVTPDLLRFTTAMINATDPRVAAAFMTQFDRPVGHWSLDALAGLPVLLATGDRDLMIPAAHTETMARLLPHSRLVVVRHAGHLLPLEQPDILNRQLIDLIKENGPW